MEIFTGEWWSKENKECPQYHWIKIFSVDKVGQVGICRQFGVPEKCAHYDILPRE